MVRKIDVLNAFKTPTKAVSSAYQGGVGYDNARENIDPHVKTQALSSQEITTSGAKIVSGSISGGLIFSSDKKSGNGLFIKGTYEDSVTTNDSVSLIYIDATNTNTNTSQLYPIKMDIETAAVDTGAGIAIVNTGFSDCIYLNVKGQTTGTAPTGLAVDLNKEDYDNKGFGIQVWDFSNTERDLVDSPSSLYLRKHAKTDTSNRLLRLYGARHLQTFELDQLSGSSKVVRAFYEPTGADVYTMFGDGSVCLSGLSLKGNISGTNLVMSGRLSGAYVTANTISGSTLKIDHIGENSSAHKVIFDSEVRIGSTTDYADFKIVQYDGSTNILAICPYWGTNAGGQTSIILQKGGLYLQGVTASGGDQATPATLLQITSDAVTGYNQMVLNESTGNTEFDTGGIWKFVTGDLEVSKDIYFVTDSSGLPYGSCWGNEIGWSQASAAQNTWYAISDTDMTDGELNLITHDGSGKLTVSKAGRYLINWAWSGDCDTVGKHVQLGISISGTVNNAGMNHFYTATASQEYTASGTAIIDLAASATIEVAMRTTDTGTPTLSCDHLNITAVMVGGT